MATNETGRELEIKTSRQEHNIAWATSSMNLPDILKNYSLPVIVKMEANDKSKPKKDASATLQQPLMLYKEIKGYKIVARNVSSLVAVKTSKAGVQFKEGGSVIVLPVDYNGWFRVLEEDSVPILGVANLARVMPVKFLSAKRVTGFTILDPLNRKDIMYEKLEFPPGVFTVHSVFEDHVKYVTEKNSVKRKLLRCLVCMTEDNLDVLIPFDMQGEFYIIEYKKPMSKTTKAEKNSFAYTLKQLVAMGVFTRPLVLKLLIGDPPNKPCGFTGVMKVFDIVKDWTVVAETLDGSQKLLELPVLPFPEFIPSTNGKDLLEFGSLRSELQYMSNGAAEKYSKEIKVKTSFNLESPPRHHGEQTALPPVKDRSDQKKSGGQTNFISQKHHKKGGQWQKID